MVCRNTSSAERHRQAGFTLAESLVGAALAVLILATVCVLWGFANESFAAVLNYVEMASASKNTLDRMSRQIRNAGAVTGCTSHELKLVDLDGREFKFTYDPTRRTLTQTKSNEVTTLLKGCNDLSFSIFQRTPLAGSDSLSAAESTNTTKVVQMNWTCSRILSGARRNSERQVSAKVVIRNR